LRTIDQNTLKKLQNVVHEMLDDFVLICEENGFTYYLSQGTLLGAVRHKGFIPWDDDIDIGMPRNDYEKFLDLFEKNIETNYYVLSYRHAKDPRYQYKPFAKFCKKGTILAEDNIQNGKTYCGIFIDIWPFDNCVNFFSPLQNYFISFAWKLYHFRTKAYLPNKKIKRFLVNLFIPFFPLRLCRKLLGNAYSFFNKFKTEYMCCFVSRYGYKKETHKRNTIFPLIKVCFEENYYWAPGNCDLYLKRIYGNYMEIPPVEQRKVHDFKFVVFDEDRVV